MCSNGCLQGEVLVPLELEVSTAFARLLCLAGQAVGSHLHKGAEPRATAGQLGGLWLGRDHCGREESQHTFICTLYTHTHTHD